MRGHIDDGADRRAVEKKRRGNNNSFAACEGPDVIKHQIDRSNFESCQLRSSCCVDGYNMSAKTGISGLVRRESAYNILFCLVPSCASEYVDEVAVEVAAAVADELCGLLGFVDRHCARCLWLHRRCLHAAIRQVT